MTRNKYTICKHLKKNNCYSYSWKLDLHAPTNNKEAYVRRLLPSMATVSEPRHSQTWMAMTRNKYTIYKHFFRLTVIVGSGSPCPNKSQRELRKTALALTCYSVCTEALTGLNGNGLTQVLTLVAKKPCRDSHGGHTVRYLSDLPPTETGRR